MKVIFLSLVTLFICFYETYTQTTCSPNPCFNGGVCTSSGCVCGSGYSGKFCENLTTGDLCKNICCKNGGVCNVVQPTMSECWCLSGFGGYYCELKAAASRCYETHCLNGGTCEETLSGYRTFAFCNCPAGYTGTRCETEYFRCNGNGSYIDIYGHEQGRFLECSNFGKTLDRRDCPPGLRFSYLKGHCDYATSSTCN